MVLLYQCTVKACEKKHRSCWCISQASYRHSYSYYYDHIPYLCCSRWIFSDTCSQLIPLALKVESKGLPLRALFHSCWSQLVDPEFEHLLFWQTIYTVLANSLYCSGKQSILYWQTVYTVLANSLYCTGKQSILYWQTIYIVLKMS